MDLSTQELEWGRKNNMDKNKKTDNNNFDKISKNDFKFVQMDEKIHDVKFETKPTTFLKDAFRRFTKNKSSVTAAVIIGVLITMALTVPVINKSNITNSFPQGTFLTPRVPGFDNINSMNGTKEYNNIVLDMSNPDTPQPVGFFLDSIVSDIKISDSYYTVANQYGSGGEIVLRPDRRDRDVALVTPFAKFDLTNNYRYTMVVVEPPTTLMVAPNYAVMMDVKYGDSTTSVPVVLKNYASDIGIVTQINIEDNIIAQRPAEITDNEVSARFRFELKTTAENVNNGTFPSLSLKSFKVENLSEPFDDTFKSTVSGINFSEGNELLLRDKINLNPRSWRIATSGSTGTLYSGSLTARNVLVKLGSFRYDLYNAAFGDRVKTIGEQELLKFVALGYIEYDFNVGVDSFVLLDAENSPIREIRSQKVTNLPGLTVKEVSAVVSIYRYYGYSDIPYFLFGTNQRGHDFFKVVFSGLNTSLMLGLIVATVNIIIGIVWGAISGYYGGTIDLVMERFTEILSGVPSIVVMTLAILTLGNSFGVFVMAMIMTGWIGTAARTRSQFYRYKHREYVLASRTLGANDGRIIFRHILPNSMGPIITSGVLMIPGIIFTEASISYLNLGLQGLPSFGVAMSEVQGYIHTSPYLIVSAAVIVSLLMISFNLFGNGLRDAFNPSLKGVE